MDEVGTIAATVARQLMQQHGDRDLVVQRSQVSRSSGKIISFSCYVIGWFMPYYFAGRLESGNVCEYFVMMHYFNDLGITEHDDVLLAMKWRCEREATRGVFSEDPREQSAASPV